MAAKARRGHVRRGAEPALQGNTRACPKEHERAGGKNDQPVKGCELARHGECGARRRAPADGQAHQLRAALLAELAPRDDCGADAPVRHVPSSPPPGRAPTGPRRSPTMPDDPHRRRRRTSTAATAGARPRPAETKARKTARPGRRPAPRRRRGTAQVVDPVGERGPGPRQRRRDRRPAFTWPTRNTMPPLTTWPSTDVTV